MSQALHPIRKWWVLGSSIAFLGLMLFAIGGRNALLQNLLLFLPAAVFVLLVSLQRFERFLFLIVFVTPFSMGLKDVGGGVGFSLPGELMLAIAALVCIALFLHRPRIDRRIILHPVTIVILLQLAWVTMLIPASTYSLISAKFLVARICYLLVFYFAFAILFREIENITRFLWLYLLGLLPVMLHSLFKLSSMGLERKFSPEMAEPYFDDHTVFGAVLALLLPAALLLYRNRRQMLVHLRATWLLRIMLPLLVACLFFSFSRAAWLSVIALIPFYVFLRLRIRFRWLLLAFLILAGVGYGMREQIVERFRTNENVSGKGLLSTAASVTNVTTDDSNRERVNRWSSALKMYKERPWTGFGAGTYERNYGIYQTLSEKTRISTNDGDRGDAHSEYLTALTEQGIPGLVLLLVLILFAIRTGMRVYYTSANKNVQILALAILLGLVTYYIHGAVNSFLDLDKTASLFWAMTAMLVAMDVHSRTAKKSPKND